VKVLRPGIERRVADDAESLRLAARLIDRWIPPARRLEPVAFADTVIRAITLELDLRLEAAGADELREVMAKDAYMAAPPIVWDGVARRVLTMEWARGWPLSDEAALTQPGLDRQLMADNLIRAFLSQALDHGVFHADLHEGNLFAAAPGVADGGGLRDHRADRACGASLPWPRSSGASRIATMRLWRAPASKRAMCRPATASRPSPRPCGRSAKRCSAAPPARCR
jgi:hypothetical protein